MCSDHFHPWSRRQGHSGFAWSWLGSALEATTLTFGTVCAPVQRYHPAVIAQAAATLAEMYPGRFWLAVGTGERLNENITGGPWPSKDDRNRRLEEAVTLMRRLWAGETVTARGLVSAEHAQVYVHAAKPPLVVAAALSPETAGWAAGWADGLITVAGPVDAMRAIVDAFRTRAGAEKPIFLQVPLSFAPTDEQAMAAAMDQWRHAALPAASLADLVTPDDFDIATESVRDEQLRTRLRVSSDVSRHIDWLQADMALGFERVFLHNVAREHQEWFIDVFGDEVLPELARD